jgi:hypothetical protein
MQLTRSIYNKLTNAIDHHFSAAKENIYATDKFKKLAKEVTEDYIQKVFKDQYLPKKLSDVACLSDKAEITVVIESFNSVDLGEITLDKEYPILNRQFKIGGSIEKKVSDAYFERSPYSMLHDVTIKVQDLPEDDKRFNSFKTSCQSFDDAKINLIKIVKEHYNKQASLERLSLNMPSIKMFLNKIGIQL